MQSKEWQQWMGQLKMREAKMLVILWFNHEEFDYNEWEKGFIDGNMEKLSDYHDSKNGWFCSEKQGQKIKDIYLKYVNVLFDDEHWDAFLTEDERIAQQLSAETPHSMEPKEATRRTLPFDELDDDIPF